MCMFKRHKKLKDLHFQCAVQSNLRLNFLYWWTRPDTLILQSRVDGQEPYLRSQEHLGRSSEAKDHKNKTRIKCDWPTNQTTDGRSKQGSKVARVLKEKCLTGRDAPVSGTVVLRWACPAYTLKISHVSGLTPDQKHLSSQGNNRNVHGLVWSLY